MNYQIISDGSCDLSQELAKEKNIEIVPFYVSFDSETYQKEVEEVGVRDFYQQMIDYPNVFPKTSCPSAQDYYDIFEKYAVQNIPMICICITMKFSASYQSAIIDSQINTVLQGLYVLEACRLRDNGYNYEDAITRLKEIRSSGRIFFTIGSIDYLKHGGRIGKVAGIAGSLLNIKPLITLKEGEIFSSGIVRSRKKSMTKVIGLLQDHLKEFNIDMQKYSICIGYGYSREEAEEFRDMLMVFLDIIKDAGVKEIPIYQIGATIGVHTGPNPLGVCILKRADY